MGAVEKIEDVYQSACLHCGSATAPFVIAESRVDFAVCCNRNNGGCGATGGFARTVIEAIMNWNRRP
jgi:hypothetical protein